MIACCIKRLNTEIINKYEKKNYLNGIILFNEFIIFLSLLNLIEK